MNIPESPIDRPENAAWAWARYRRLMIWMALAALVTTVASLVGLSLMIGAIPFWIAFWTGLGVFVSVLLAAALMGLVFLSSGTGHDRAIIDPLGDER